MHTSNCAADDTKLSKPNRFYSVWFAFLLIVWPLVAVLGLYALGQPLPSLSLLTSPRFLTMQIIVDYSMALAFVACALLFNKRTAKHANVINELRRELAVFKDENGELQDELAKSKDENGELQDELASVRAELEVDSTRPRISLLKLKTGSMKPTANSTNPGTTLTLPSPNSGRPSSSFVVQGNMLSSMNAATKVSVRNTAKPC